MTTTLRDAADLPRDIVWRVLVESDGTKHIEVAPTTGFGIGTALAVAMALRAVAKEIEEAAAQVETVLYGKGGSA